jgi:hypothetical protein
MFVPFPVLSVRGHLRRMLEMDGESVTLDARVELLIFKIELEAELVTIVGNGSMKIIDKKLRGYPSNVRNRAHRHFGHIIPR